MRLVALLLLAASVLAPTPARAQESSLLATLPHRGAPPGAPVTLLEVSDYQCPFCSRLSPTLDEVMDTWGHVVTHYFLDFPLDFHKDAFKAHEATACAARQGRFWEVHKMVFASQRDLSVPTLLGYGRSLGIDSGAYSACLESGQTHHLIEQRRVMGKELGVKGTPAVFINGEMISGSRPYEAYDTAIREALGR